MVVILVLCVALNIVRAMSMLIMDLLAGVHAGLMVALSRYFREEVPRYNHLHR